MDKEHPDKCPNCGEQFFGPVKFCPFCGRRVEDVPSPPFDLPKRGPLIESLSARSLKDNKATITALARSEDGLNVARAEWWVGNDPGPGNGKPMSAIEGSFKSSRVDVTALIDVSRFEEGEYTLNVRSADVRGVWGGTQTTTFTARKKQAKPLKESPDAETIHPDTGSVGSEKELDDKRPESRPEPPSPPHVPKPHLARNIIIGVSIAVCLIVGYLIVMPKGKATVSISSKPPGATLTIDGENKGQTPKAGISLNSGTHHIVLEKKGYAAEQDVPVKSGEKKSLMVTLKKKGPPVERSSGRDVAATPDKTPPPANHAPFNNASPDIVGFIEQCFRDTRSRDIDLVLSHYGEQVDYFSKGTVGKDFIRRDRQSYFKRWTTIVNTLDGQPQAQETAQDNTRVVRFASQFFVNNEKQSITGKADNTWTLKRENSQWRIIGEQQQVLSRVKN